MTIQLDTLHLDSGAHRTREEGVCLLEAVAWLAGESHSDHPECVSPVLAAYGRSLNDHLNDQHRQLLTPLAPLLIGTVNPDRDQVDGLACAHWYVTHWCPLWLDLVPALDDHATAMRALPVPATWDDVAGWKPILVAAGAAAWAAAWAAARDAAWAAARAAARAAAGAAAWDAAGAAAWDAAGAAARDAAGAAAWDAAWDAARAAARDAARDAAGVALKPTADQLRDDTIAHYALLVTARAGAR